MKKRSINIDWHYFNSQVFDCWINQINHKHNTTWAYSKNKNEREKSRTIYNPAKIITKNSNLCAFLQVVNFLFVCMVIKNENYKYTRLIIYFLLYMLMMSLQTLFILLGFFKLFSKRIPSKFIIKIMKFLVVVLKLCRLSLSHN